LELEDVVEQERGEVADWIAGSGMRLPGFKRNQLLINTGITL